MGYTRPTQSSCLKVQWHENLILRKKILTLIAQNHLVAALSKSVTICTHFNVRVRNILQCTFVGKVDSVNWD
jgi:hypothetical protein